MTSPRWATEVEFNPSRDRLAQTPGGAPAFWAAIVTREPSNSNLPDELVLLGEPRDQQEGRAAVKVLQQAGQKYRVNLDGPAWVWRREDHQIVLLRQGVECARLPEPSA